MSDLLRAPRADEAAYLTDLCLNSKRSLGYDETFMALCVDELTITPEKLEQSEFWGVDRGGILLGIGALTLCDDETVGEIEKFFIHPDHRGTGIGRVLWERLLESAYKKKLSRLTLTAEPLSAGFYERFGFVVVGQEPSGSIPGRFLPLMQLELEQGGAT